MTRNARRWVWIPLFLFAATASAQPGRTGDEPNQETLRRLAQQLGAGNAQLPPNIDPELMKLAAEYLKKNPDVLKDPAFQKQVEQMRKQAKQDPERFSELMKQQNPGLSQQQIESLKQQFQQSNPGGFQPPNIGQPPQPDFPPGGPRPMPPDFPRPVPPPDGPRPRPITPDGPRPIPPDDPGPIPPDGPRPFPPGGPGPGTPQWEPNGQFPPQSNPWQEAEQKAQAKQEYQQVVGLWENSFGSIDETPALKQSLVDMFSGDGKSPWDGSGSNGNSPFNGGKNGTQKPWWQNGNGSNSGNQSGFINWLKNTTSSPPSWWKKMTGGGNSNFKPPSVGGSGWTPPRPSGGFGGGGFGSVALAGVGLPVILLVGLIVVLTLAFLVWRYWPQIQAMRNQPKPIPGLGAWTIDPREVTDRETLVRAFEYLSVLICGDGARVWNHQTIADAFHDNVPGAAPFADPLARLYAIARYSPAHEPMTPADIAEARGYLCRLAEVPA